MRARRSKRNMLTDVAIGQVAGIAGTVAMDQFFRLWNAISKKEGDDKPQKREEPSTVKTADAIWKGVTRTSLPESSRKLAGQLVHYGFGAGVGAAYGALAHVDERTTRGRGILYGLGVWLAADEIAVPALGLSKGPAKAPFSSHLMGLGAHLVY